LEAVGTGRDGRLLPGPNPLLGPGSVTAEPEAPSTEPESNPEEEGVGTAVGVTGAPGVLRGTLNDEPVPITELPFDGKPEGEPETLTR